MLNKLGPYLSKPALYAPSSSAFWDDEHISKGMLAAHLNPDWEAATRRHDFVDESVRWIAQIAPPAEYPALLDLGCGPGLYAQRFFHAGYAVTGVDFSRRSIAYAKEQALLGRLPIQYRYQDYLTLGDEAAFDVVTLIYCDYGALSLSGRARLLGHVYRALKPGGKFLFDVFTPRMRRGEGHSWAGFPQGGFYSASPHLCLEAVYQYDDEDRTELRQAIVVTDDSVNCYNIWDHFFTREKVLGEVQAAGFQAAEFYGDAAGRPCSDAQETICAVVAR